MRKAMMDWFDKLNLAIEYMENNIDDKNSIAEASKVACCSSFHFQKMFYAIIGITPAEYIRRRRLTLAATELAIGNMRTIDIALKYGYESPNSFTRAFRNMHGINPRDVRKYGAKLSAYNRISLHVEIKGGKSVDYRIIEKPAFKILGKSKVFTHDNFFNDAPKFWKEYVSTEEYQTLWNIAKGKWGIVTEAPLMSVYLPDVNGKKDTFTDILGIENILKTDNKKFTTYNIPAATYAEFSCTYQTAARMNRYIYGEWMPSTGHERDANKPDIAAYFPVAFMSTRGMGVRWWIPIVKKK
jgi:AraC family transcriptional regulator